MVAAYAFSLPPLCFASAFSLFLSDMQFVNVAVMEKQMCKSAQARRNVALRFCLQVRRDIIIWYIKGHGPGSEYFMYVTHSEQIKYSHN